MENLFPVLELAAPFNFACSPQVPCFTECCRDLNQPLSPYDVLRLNQGLRMPSQRFLAQYALQHTGPGSGLPVVTLKPADPERLTCPLLTSSGCRVYADRPSSCRTYPLVRVARRCRSTEAVSAEYRVLKEPHCRGFGRAGSQTAAEWIAGQQTADYETENDRLLEVISLKNRLRPGPLPPSLAGPIFIALYDLDRFREQVFAGRLRIPQLEMFPTARQDDLALLRLALEWVKELLAG